MKKLLLLAFILVSVNAIAQKKVLDHMDFDIWNTIKNSTISSNGDYVMYSLEKGEKDQTLMLHDTNGGLIFEYTRGEGGTFSHDSEYAIFTIKAWADSVMEMKRRKIKEDKLPKDTLAIYSLKDHSLTKIPNVQSSSIPEDWGGFIAYQLTTPETSKSEKKDTTKEKKSGKDNGYHLVLRNLESSAQDTIRFVKEYIFAKEGPILAYVTTGDDSLDLPGVFVRDLKAGNTNHVLNAKGEFKIILSETGQNLAIIADQDTTKAQTRPNELHHWRTGLNQSRMLMDNATAPEGYVVSANGRIEFSQDEKRLYFGLSQPPIIKDTTLLDEEIVNVEVWTYDEPRLYTVQELQVDSDRKKSYMSVVDLSSGVMTQLGRIDLPEVSLGDEGNAPIALASTSVPYQLERQWTGGTSRDYSIINLGSGTSKQVLTKLRGNVQLSPKAKYAFGYDAVDSAWFVLDAASNEKRILTKGQVFFNELNDAPNFPYPYGSAGWTEEDKALILYDRYDLWSFDPISGKGTRLTKGRENKTTYRYLRLDTEERNLPSGKWLLSMFNETTKDAGYYDYNTKNGKGAVILNGPYRYSRPVKAKDSDQMIYTRQSFTEFPDVRTADRAFRNEVNISDANPQQSEYNWGTSELVTWTSLDGIELEGMLIKPENFDPAKKYPMIVNFYEKSSNGLHAHRAPSPGRSTINYSFYASRGYVIFNPNVHYRIGYPGESAYNCVIPGVTALIDKGFIDKDNIGVQGHSWGGYQIAYLVTKTDIFKAAEAGAPVPNMISAYGGIRWWSGLSRQFQYEHTQSRIGGTPWEYPVRFVENSPIFFLDKVNTPLMIMHNDADGHVPWYQGIELFVSLRRLGKPSWFLNYNDEPHWPLKLQNRKDFNIRMAQFFDHYLQEAPKPVWMERGVPALEKGINQGLELMDK